MARPDDGLAALTSPHSLPYVLVGTGLLAGLFVVFAEPLPWRLANWLVGGVLLAVATGAVTFLIARNSAPGERGPDF